MLRVMDILLSALGLIVGAPVVLICVIVHKLTQDGSAIFAQPRVGLSRSVFLCLKLRTMRVGTPQLATHQVSVTSVTPLGGFLRRTKLDELPQLWNVLKGEMSLVGPRPCLPTQVELIEARQALGLYDLRPGVTGPAQVRGIDMSDPGRLAKVDETWLKERSLHLYFKIIIETVSGSGGGDRVTT
jgi:O-antigen biosynthesis protein WbqP